MSVRITDVDGGMHKSTEPLVDAAAGQHWLDEANLRHAMAGRRKQSAQDQLRGALQLTGGQDGLCGGATERETSVGESSDVK